MSSTTGRFKNVSISPAVPNQADLFIFQPPLVDGGWFKGSYNASSVGESGVLFSSNNSTANVTFTFPDPAIAFYYYGIKRSHGGLYAICIDCSLDRANFMQIDGFNATDDGQNPPIVLFSDHFDTPGIHSFLLANQLDPRGTPFGNSQITLERIDIEVPDDDPLPATVVQTIAGTPTSSPSSSVSPTPSSIPVGAIIGASIAATAAVLFLLLGTFCFIRRRRKKREALSTAPISDSSKSNITTGAAAYPSHVGGNANSPTSSRYTGASSHQQQQSMSSFYYPSTGSQSDSSTIPSSRRPRREMDAGRIYEEDEPEGTLPPEYGSIFSNARSPSSGAAARSQRSRGSRRGNDAASGGVGDQNSSSGLYSDSSQLSSRQRLSMIKNPVAGG